MPRFFLQIRSPYETKQVTVESELSIGRTDVSDVALDDGGLSRKHATFFVDGDELLVVDEGSTNGTFLNGERLAGRPRTVRDGDEVKLGSGTTITVGKESREERGAPVATEAPASPTRSETKPETAATPKTSKSAGTPFLLIAAIALFVLILGIGGGALLLVNNSGNGNSTGRPTPPIASGLLIPVRVTDPLGGEDPDDLDDLIASWEVEEKELDLKTLQDVKVTNPDASTDEKSLEVTAAFLADRKAKAFEVRSAPTGISPPGLKVPPELRGDGVIKQKAKLAQMKSTGYQQPMDFGDLAKKRLDGELIEMPMATQSFYLEVGGSASNGPFTAFSFQSGDTPIPAGSPKFSLLQQVAQKFSVSLDDPAGRKQIRTRLLRMFNQRAKPVLEELAGAYLQRFGRPLRVTSLTRSMDYQISLNKNNPNSFKVRGEGSLPPHTSGCAFDLARKHMGVDEQNFLMEKIAEMERAKRLDGLIEYGVNACFHIFIYYDGVAPNM